MSNVRWLKSIKKYLMVSSFLLPALILYVLFMLIPIGKDVRYSFFQWNGNTPTMKFVGWSNYVGIFQDPVFIESMVNNLIWIVASLALIVAPVLVLAVMISKVKKGKTIFRTIFYLPAVIALPVVAVIWSSLYDPYISPLNAFLNAIGLGKLGANWLGNPYTVTPSLIIASLWAFYGLYLVLYLAGLQNVDYSLYEAAEIDGANAWNKLMHVTVPSLRNTMNLVISLVMINALKAFSLIWIMTQGGPFYKSEVVATYVYQEVFTSFNVGTGSAASVVLALIIIVITIAFNSVRERNG